MCGCSLLVDPLRKAKSDILREILFLSSSICRVMSQWEVFRKTGVLFLCIPGISELESDWSLVMNRRRFFVLGHDSRIAKRTHSLLALVQLIQVGKDSSHRTLRSDTVLEDELLLVQVQIENLGRSRHKPLHVQQDCCPLLSSCLGFIWNCCLREHHV